MFTKVGGEVNVVVGEDGDEVYAKDQYPKEVDEESSGLQSFIMIIFIEEIDLKGEYAVEDSTGHGRDGFHHHHIAEKACEQDAAHKGEEVLQLPVVPFDEVAVDLNAEDVEHEVGVVAVEEGTHQNPPELVVELYPGVVLILKFEQGTVPGELVLHRSRVDVDDFGDEAQHQEEAHDERCTLHSEMGEEDGVEGRGSQPQKLIRAFHVAIGAFAHGLFIPLLQMLPRP